RLGRHGFFGVLRRAVRPPKAELLEVHALLDRLGIAEKMFHRTDSLSGGMQQRVAIARALFQEPHVLLADEPVASVDPARAVDLLRLLRAVAEERQLPLVVSLHDVQLARACFPRVVGMRAGAVVFDAPTADVDTAAFEELYAL
ncbi:MAG: ATP-binding cassette domain-containing protein, partial [Planctomycetes bacterium]|nr:ATP-binding cassette domain-containing protein [Planctomycetota bacterium]